VRKKPAAKLKLVLDSNVLISAFVFGGKPREILDLAVKGRVDVAISAAILDEISGVLGGKKFQYPKRIVRALIAEIESLADLVEPGERVNAIQDDPEDNRVLECAVASGASVIVSGDSHLLALHTFGQMSIMSPGEFIDLMSSPF
jgi:uncharacterized protein